ncbi:MAG TPA: hypothetical protein VME40_02330 [Caulobacteraceae bacterium]|nr:hypothetical protein [Caulobacteraceae bacterium]
MSGDRIELPASLFSVGVTGHRARNPTFASGHAAIGAALEEIFGHIDRVALAVASEPGAGTIAPTRLHCLAADGVDQMAAEMALARGWELVCPLPFGRALNTAINAAPQTAQDARALLAGEPAADPAVQARAAAIGALLDRARVFELAEKDEEIAALFLAGLEAPADLDGAALFAAEASERVALAGRVAIEQSDVLVAVWDRETTAHAGGTGHTVAAALAFGAPVVFVDSCAPQAWRILRAPESLASLDGGEGRGAGRLADLEALVRAVLAPQTPRQRGHGQAVTGLADLEGERWRGASHPLWHAYRRAEALFGADTFSARFRRLRQVYEPPEAIAEGSAAAMLACAHTLPGQDAAFVAKAETAVVRGFAWFDGVSSRLSDAYRGGMVINFLLAPLAIVAGIAYLPFASPGRKWAFALAELALLATVLAVTGLGQRRRWHARWFQTRRVAEYLRQAPILMLLGVARAPGRWPRGVDATWPEWFARQTIRSVGLPHLAVTPAYLRIALGELLDEHVTRQRDYHLEKARRLSAAHRNLDRLSTSLFALAIVAVAAYLALAAGDIFARLPAPLAERVSFCFTFLGVLLPTFGSAVAGIRYFGDFERFAAISEVTAEKLDAAHGRIRLLLSGPDSALDYGRAAELAHAADDVVVAEIENWQAVFGGKHLTVPA